MICAVVVRKLDLWSRVWLLLSIPLSRGDFGNVTTYTAWAAV